jgi:beta-galactosidase
MPLTAQVVTRKGMPSLLINGKPTPPLMVFVNLVGEKPEAGLSTIRRAAQAGIHLVSFVVHASPWNPPHQLPDYRPYEEQIEAILKENPRALLLPRVGLSYVPEWWAKQHPDEMMLYDNGERGYVSVVSRIWRQEATERLRLLVQHLESRYGDHIFGYHPCGQNTGEWFYDRVWEGLLPSFETPMRDAFRRYLRDPNATLPSAEERKARGIGAFLNPATQQRLVQFWRFQQEVMVEPLEAFARIIKEETAGRKLVVLFYGYTFELSGLPGGPAVSGHLALQRLLKCKDVDILCSPISYFDREAGGAGGFMAPVDSVQLHGKLWLNEDDTRTYLSKPEDNFGRAETLAHTLAVHQRNFAHIATRGAACWWMDLMGAGWLDSTEIWGNLANLCKLYEKMLPNRQPYQPQVAVVVDEASLYHLAYGNAITLPLLSQMRYELYRIGAPLGFYLLSDVCAGAAGHARMYLMLNAFAPTESQRRALKDLLRKGKMVVWFYAPGFIRGSSASAGHITDQTGIQVVQKEEIRSGIARTEPAAVLERAGVNLEREEEFGTREPLSPGFVVRDASAHTLATFIESGDVAAAIKRTVEGWSVYLGTLRAGIHLLRALAVKADVHLYSGHALPVVSVGNGIVSLHGTQQPTQETYISLPDFATVYEPTAGEVVEQNVRSVRVRIEKGQTRLIQLLRGGFR